jgi:hypothetical protein
MLELIYTSATFKPFSEPELTVLLQKARLKNARLGITGMLVYDEGSFLQIIEGNAEVVQALFNVIREDARHHRVIKLLETTVPGRSFDTWSMGFVTTAHLRSTDLAGYSELLGRGFSPDSFLPASERAKARQMLLAFREGRWRTYVGT